MCVGSSGLDPKRWHDCKVWPVNPLILRRILCLKNTHNVPLHKPIMVTVLVVLYPGSHCMMMISSFVRRGESFPVRVISSESHSQ